MPNTSLLGSLLQLQHKKAPQKSYSHDYGPYVRLLDSVSSRLYILLPRGSIYTTIMELAPKDHPHYGFGDLIP